MALLDMCVCGDRNEGSDPSEVVFSVCASRTKENAQHNDHSRPYGANVMGFSGLKSNTLAHTKAQ